jgi:hypothetical protein
VEIKIPLNRNNFPKNLEAIALIKVAPIIFNKIICNSNNIFHLYMCKIIINCTLSNNNISNCQNKCYFYRIKIKFINNKFLNNSLNQSKSSREKCEIQKNTEKK